VDLYQYHDQPDELIGYKLQDLLPDRILNYARYLKRSGLPIELSDQQRSNLATNAELSLYFALLTKSRFPEGEPQILKNPTAAALYARDVILGPWPRAERIIAQDRWAAETYIYDVLKKPWPPGEAEIAIDPIALRNYLTHFPERQARLGQIIQQRFTGY
jgi:hypothetical protein